MKTLLALWSVLLISSLSYGQRLGYKSFTQEEVQTLKHIKVQDTNWGSLPQNGVIKSYSFKNKKIEGVWSGSYWPMVQGGITSRWQRKEQPFAQIPTYEEISRMTKSQKNTLSPAEKYDYIMGDRAMTLTKAERSYIKSNGKLQSWFGYCHGTASASINEKEPLSAIEVPVNGSKETVVFYQDDMKALITAFYAHSQGSTIGMGDRCNADFDGRPIADLFKRNQAGCNDTNPGAFHIALANRIKQNKSFVVEIDKGSEIWNYAVYGYEILRERSVLGPRGLRYKYRRIDLALYYVDGTNPSTNRQFKLGKKQLDYTLQIDKRTGEIVGGQWNHEFAKGGNVDFIWFKDSAGKDKRNVIDLELVRQMISASRK